MRLFPCREPMLAQGDARRRSSVFALSPVVLNLKAQGVEEDDIVPILMPRWFFDLLRQRHLVNTNFAEENHRGGARLPARPGPKGFRDWFLCQRSRSGIGAVLQRADILDRGVEIERLTMANEMNINTPYVQENGFGDIDMERLQRAFDQLTVSMGLSGAVGPEDVVDMQYLPPAEDRMF